MRNPVALTTDDPSPPMASLIDIAFLLLIFFLVTTTLLKKETDLDLRLGTRGPAAATPDLPIEVHVDEFGSVLVGPASHPELVEPAGTGPIGEALRQRLRIAVDASGPDQLPVLLDASAEATHQRVVSVLDTLAGLGIRQLNLVDHDDEAPE